MNMNTLLNEDNEGYSWEGDYEQTWFGLKTQNLNDFSR